METRMPKLPFEASLEEILKDPEPYVDAVFSCLQSEFLVMPRGVGFVEYPVFERGYEALKSATDEFSDLSVEKIYGAVLSKPICIVVLRTVLGFTPPEWAYVTTQKTGISVTQGFVRSLDRKVRVSPEKPLGAGKVTGHRLKALIETACHLLSEGTPRVDGARLHRLEKADTKSGSESLRNLARMGAPYAMLLYERFLGRPFAGHRDSVSELIGDTLESAIEDVLTSEGISYRKTKRAEKVEGFDQAPDFIIPSEFNPEVVIESKITEDDGTARDKVTRIQHLGELSVTGQDEGAQRFQVIACIGGRDFGVKREDMKKMLIATRGKVFTVDTLPRMVSYTRLKEFASKPG
jgi:hypothetical protein